MNRRVFLGSVPAATAAQIVTNPVATGPVAKPQGSIRIAAMDEFDPQELQILKNAAPGRVEILVARNRDEFRRNLRDADVVYGILRASELDFAPKLKWLQWPGAGMETMDPALKNHPVVVTNMARIYAPGISETAMGLLLCLTRGITTYYMPQFYKHQMKPVGTIRSADHIELGGRTMGIVGMGGIGSAIARRACTGRSRCTTQPASRARRSGSLKSSGPSDWLPQKTHRAELVSRPARSLFSDLCSLISVL